MQICHAKTMTLLVLLAQLGLTACAGPADVGPTRLVEQAYNTPGIIKVPPYRRTIFSTTDF